MAGRPPHKHKVRPKCSGQGAGYRRLKARCPRSRSRARKLKAGVREAVVSAEPVGHGFFQMFPSRLQPAFLPDARLDDLVVDSEVAQ